MFSVKRLSFLCLFLILMLARGPMAQAQPAGGIVGDGTPASCTEAALNTALTGGGNVTFDCGALPVVIVLSGQKTISVATQIDGSGLITLRGNGSRHFFVPAGAALTLRNLTLSHGFANGDGGSLYNQGTLLIDNVTLQNNATANNFSGGAIVNYGDLTIANSTLQDNAGGNGGAVYPRWSGSRTHIINSVLRQNHAANATGWGGALLAWDGAVVVIEDSQLIGNTAIEGGAIYNTGNSDVTLHGSVLRENTASKWGGAIVNNQQLLIRNSTLADNTGHYQGGGILNQGGAVQIESSTIAGNLLTAPDGMGGNIANWYLVISRNDYRYGTLTLTDSTVAEGDAPYAGGGIFTYGPMTVARSALVANTTAGRGGAIYMAGGDVSSILIDNSTLADNHAGNHGGAIYKESGPLSIAFSTVAGNSAQQEGSNLYMDQGQPAATTTIMGTILAGGDCVQNGLVSAGYNLDSGDSCGFNHATDRVNSDPLLEPLADNGGPTLTRLPRPNSPAINAIPDGCPARDQRGYPRPLGPGCDMGAVEFDGWQATAEPFIVAMPDAVRAGSQLRVVGFHFERGKPYRFYLDGVAPALGATLTDTAGHFDLTLTVPAGFSPAGAQVSLTVWRDFEPIEAVATQALAALPSLGLSLSTSNALPGATITATVTNVAAGRLQVHYGAVVVAGPLTVGAGTVAVPFVVPLSGGQAPGAPITVQAQNVVAGLTLGTASAIFTPRVPGSFDFNTQPNATVQAIPQPAPGWTGDQAVAVSGALPDVPVDLRGRVKIDVMFRDQQGRSFPLLAKPLSLDANARFNALVRLPSLFRGDPLPGGTPGSVVVSARLDDVVKLFAPSNVIPPDQSPFGIKIVRRLAGPLDGTVIPDTPTGNLRLSILAQGTVLADSDALTSATFAEALTAAFKSVYSDQIGAAISSVVEKYNECHPIIPQREVQPWEMAWRPSDEFQLLADQQQFALLNVGQIAQRFNVGRIPGLVAADAAALVQVRFILVTVDATEVQDGATAPNGYGPPETLNDDHKIAYRGLYAVAPSTGKVFLVKGYDASHLLTPITFELLPDGPVEIGLSPYPAGAKSRLEFDVTVPGLNILGVAHVEDATLRHTVPVRTFGRLYSFANFPYALSIDGDALEIHILFNEGAAYNQPPASAVSMNLYLHGGGNPIPLPVTVQGFGTDPCKGVPKERFVATMMQAYKTLPPGLHKVVVQVNDNLTHLERQVFLQVDAPPGWFLNSQYKNRRVVWSVSQTSLFAARYDPSDDTATPGDLQIDAPSGPSPDTLHVDNASGLDSRVVQILTPSGPGAVTQPTQSRAKSWNNNLGSASAQSAGADQWPTVPGERGALTTPINTCTPGPFVQCIGPTHTGIPRKEMALFPPILWGIPPIADVKIAGTLAYEAGLDVTGMVRLDSTTPEAQVTVWPYARVSVAIDVAGEILGGLIGRLGINTSGNVNVDVPVTFSTAGKSDLDACFRWFVRMRIYAQAGCIPFTDACLADKTLDERNLLDGREPNSPFCNSLPLAAAEATRDAATLAPLPPSANPTIASDGVHMLAIWNAPSHELVYSVFDGNDWGAAQAIAPGRMAERPAVVFYGINRAVAVWNGSELEALGNDLTLDQVLDHQVLEYALWDGVSWSAPARLTPASVRDGGAVLAACTGEDANCPGSGEVTAAWTHIESAALVEHQLRIYTARFADGVWSDPQPVDPASASADTAPMVAYALGEPVVAWVRDSDRNFATADDRRIALRRMDSATVDAPAALPNQIVAGSMVADAAGRITLAFTRAPDGALLSNHHELYAAQGTCQGGCVWTQAPLLDAQGRTLWGEHPVLTLDSHDRATITYRALGFGPNAQGVQVRAGDAPGITLGTGELAQVDLSASFGPASPRTLTHDGVLHWQPAAAYNAALNQIIALSVRGSGLVEAQSADGSAVLLADTVLIAAAPRLPDFTLEQVTLLYAAPQDTMPQQVWVNVRNNGAAWSDSTPLEIAAAWDAPALAAQQPVTVSLPGLDAGQIASVTLTLPSLSGSPDADHTVFVTVNPGRTINENDGTNNDTILPVTGVAAPAQVYLAADPVDRLLNLRWDAPVVSANVAGYRIYRRLPGGAWQKVGSSFGTDWADVNVQYDTVYEYAVSAYTATGFEGRLSLPMQAIMGTLPKKDLTQRLFLPLIQFTAAGRAGPP